MKPVLLLILPLTAALALGGCARLGLPEMFPASKDVEPMPAPVEASVAPEQVVLPVGTPQTAEALDTTSAADRAKAQDSMGGYEIGRTIASLGAATEPGFWMKTPLVDAPAKGRAVYTANGKSVSVDLIPLDGPATAGRQMSLAALRLVEAPLTGLPEMQVFKTR